MLGAQIMLEAALVLLLGTTLFHALRLERALGVLKRDRAVLEDLVTGFNESTRQAEAGVEHLRAATEGAGRHIARQIELAQRLRDDLNFLADRGERIAERLELAIRTSRMAGDNAPLPARLDGLRPSPKAIESATHAPMLEASASVGFLAGATAELDASPRLRSQAERDLLRALRGGV